MCVIVDTCVFFTAFDSAATGHEEFAPVRRWLEKGGKLVIGGTKYFDELDAPSRTSETDSASVTPEPAADTAPEDSSGISRATTGDKNEKS